MASPTVLVSDKLDPVALDIFKQKGCKADFKPGLSKEELLEIIGNYEGLAIRSATKVDEDVLKAAKKLKVIGRAGIGVDNIDVPKATAAGIVVMNTPFGNSITTAEHAIAMMFSLAREIPLANHSTHAGKWEKKRFMGVELFKKTLGVIGCGNIGSIVADRALGLKMNVLAYDPFLSEERAIELGVKKVELDELLAESDFITLHVPKNSKTLGLIDKKALAKTKPGVRIINCARGGLIVEKDLKEALESGHVAGAALDVFEEEPAHENILFGLDNVVCTPHLGAATEEAQKNVAEQVADQIGDFLTTGAVSNALNMPSISAEDAPRLKPYLKLSESLGRFMGQITEDAVDDIEITYEGTVSEVNTAPLTAALLASFLQMNISSGVNMINAQTVAKERGIGVKHSLKGSAKDHRSLISVNIRQGDKVRNIDGTLFTGKEPRIVNIEGVPIEVAIQKNMIFIRNNDEPGLIGRVGSLLGENGQNIADFRLGRKDDGTAICVISMDSEVPDDLFEQIKQLDQVRHAKRLQF